EAQLPNGQVATYRYDAFGRRIEKTVGGKTTEFIWQGERLIAESAVGHYRSYVYEPGTFRPLAMLDGEGPGNALPYYYQLDHLGTPQELTSSAGSILWSARYRAYGSVKTLEVAGIDNPLRFQGQYFDAETGLHYNRHRYYNPGTGRFLTPDPIKLAGGLNNYRYVPNPTGWVDPLGLNTCPGGDNCKPTMAEDPSNNAKVHEGAPGAPDAQWTNHGNKHVAPKAPWPSVVKSTANGGAAKYLPGTDIESLERYAFKNGQDVNNGKPWKVIDMGETIGANDGKETRYMRVELSANTIHGHPISEESFKKLTKVKKTK
ncbi:RHS repeat domain-containing protein, partial [Pseudomonas sp. MWU13-2100]|uniref:RHS repeat domain-containing protein n=1 Tax=Pseudomonas sp. MWU13-2100 TaxID=2935075 RepID=UPI00200F1A9B